MNQVNLIASSAEREAAVAFAEAAVMRPKIVGEALRRIGEDKELADALFAILETEQIIDSKAQITLIPSGLRVDLLGQLEASAAPRVA